MADSKLIFDLILKGRAKTEQGLKSVGKSFKSTGGDAAGGMDTASGATEKLDSKITELERSVLELNREIAATGGRSCCRSCVSRSRCCGRCGRSARRSTVLGMRR